VANKRLREETSTNDYRGSTPRGGNQIAGRAFNISITDQFKISELFQFFADENGKPLIVLPLWIVKGLVNINVYMYKKTGIIPLFAYLSPACFEFLQANFTVSTERARRELGWEEPRPWREVIRKLIKEYKAESSMLGHIK
jgi:nucleoside-diphosphate-sugar epimerase